MKVLFLQKDPFVNLGIMSISAYLKQHGVGCDLLIENAERDILKKIREIRPDVILFSCTTGVHKWAINTANRIKRNFDVLIVMGGPHATFYPEVIHNPFIDVICMGEGEMPMLELMNKLKKKRDITKIKNLYVKKNGKVYKNSLYNLIEDLDSLPPFDRLLYKRYPFIMKQRNFRTMTGRGCPYNCTMCFNKSIKEMYKNKGKFIRRRSIEKVIEEIVRAKNEGGIERVDFQDDTFIYDFKNWLRPFLIEYKKKVGLPFNCCVRANLISNEMVCALKKSGCHAVRMGIESGNEYLNNKVLKKNLTKKQIIDAMHILKKSGIKVETFNMVGIPGETVETALETLELNIKLKPDFAHCTLLNPYPKTEIEQYAKNHGHLDKNFNLDAFESSFFIDTPIKLKNKNEIINIQRLFNITVKFPFLYPLTKKLIKLRRNWLYDLIFKIDFAFAVFIIDNMKITDFLSLGMHSKGYFKE